MLPLQKTVSFPVRALHSPTKSRERLPDADSAQTSTSGCAGNAQPRPPRCCFTPRAPRHSPERGSANLAATRKTSQELQPLGSSLAIRRVAVASQGFFLRYGCSRSQLLWSSYLGHNSSALFPAAPGKTRSRKQQCVPWNTRLWHSRMAGRHSRAKGSTCIAPVQPPPSPSWDMQPCPEPAPPQAGQSGKAGTGKSGSRSLHKESVRSYLSSVTGPRGRTETWEALPRTTGWQRARRVSKGGAGLGQAWYPPQRWPAQHPKYPTAVTS